MNFEKRLDRLEKYICTKIAEEHKKAHHNDLQEDDMMTSLEQDEVKSLRESTGANPDRINLLTHEERLKYDLVYAHRVELKLLKEQDVVMRKSKKSAANKKLKANDPVSKQNFHRSKKPDHIKEVKNPEPRSNEKTSSYCFLTDEEIMKWDPENFDRIHEIYDENERIRKAQDKGNPSIG